MHLTHAYILRTDTRDNLVKSKQVTFAACKRNQWHRIRLLTLSQAKVPPESNIIVACHSSEVKKGRRPLESDITKTRTDALGQTWLEGARFLPFNDVPGGRWADNGPCRPSSHHLSRQRDSRAMCRTWIPPFSSHFVFPSLSSSPPINTIILESPHPPSYLSQLH
jgi:hypothetical protein